MLKLLNLFLLLTVSLEMDIKIIRPADGKPGPAPCALTCSGTEDLDNWKDGYIGQAYITVNHEECGFVSTPVVTASVAGTWPWAVFCPTVNIQTSTEAYLFSANTVVPITAEQMKIYKCRLNWSAFGYGC